MNKYIIASSLTLLVCCFTSVFQVRAATNGGNPTQRPDGQVCIAVPGGIQAMHEETGPAGLTYTTDQPNQQIHSPFTLSPPFAIALYDADGMPNTEVVFQSSGTRVWAHQFKTGNNQWSETLPVTVTVDTLEVTLPTDHASTHVCILQSVEQTPTLTPTTTATATSTGTILPTATTQMPTSTAVEPQTPTATSTPTLPATATATQTPVPLLLSTNTPTPTTTGTPVGQAVQVTPTSTAEAPTGLDPSREPSVPPPTASLYLPLIIR
ncbi:hypothetical protein BH10CHL1_BH10CHL1_06380 [soil metagenome]